MIKIGGDLQDIRVLDIFLQKTDGVFVYGCGEYGKKLIDYIVSVDMKQKIKGILVSKLKGNDSEYKGIPVRLASDVLVNTKNVQVIIATALDYRNEISIQLDKYEVSYCCMTQKLYYEMDAQVDTRPVVPFENMNFLLVGFAKCGTTMLHLVLKDMPDIYLPEKKESMYFLWKDDVENPKQDLIDIYLNNIKVGQTVGMIEPTFWKWAKEVWEEFGNEVKLVVMCRNPVNALFSQFRMLNREGKGGFDEAYQRTGRFYEEMFDEHAERHFCQEKDMFDYVKWIKEYLKYFPDNQIKIVLLEDMLKNPQEKVNEVLEHIGANCKWSGTTLPVVNDGDYVMADASGYEMAKKRMAFKNQKRRVKTEKGKTVDESELQVYRAYAQAEKIYGLKMTATQREKLEAHYNDSVRELETLLGRDLSEIWF